MHCPPAIRRQLFSLLLTLALFHLLWMPRAPGAFRPPAVEQVYAVCVALDARASVPRPPEAPMAHQGWRRLVEAFVAGIRMQSLDPLRELQQGGSRSAVATALCERHFHGPTDRATPAPVHPPHPGEEAGRSPQDCLRARRGQSGHPECELEGVVGGGGSGRWNGTSQSPTLEPRGHIGNCDASTHPLVSLRRPAPVTASFAHPAPPRPSSCWFRPACQPPGRSVERVRVFFPLRSPLRVHFRGEGSGGR